MTQQEQFEADYLAAFPTCSADLRKQDGNEYSHAITDFAYNLWLQQAKRHEAEIAELVAALKEVKWQPIETPPLNGDEVLLFDEAIYIGALRADYKTLDTWWVSDDGQELQPTHWMPLPEPPK